MSNVTEFNKGAQAAIDVKMRGGEPLWPAIAFRSPAFADGFTHRWGQVKDMPPAAFDEYVFGEGK